MPLPMSITRRHCLAAIASLPVSLAMRARTAPRDWRALRATLAAFVRERRASGVGVAIRYGDETPAYLSAGTLAFDSPAPFDENSLLGG